jgi:hypothetical protein
MMIIIIIIIIIIIMGVTATVNAVDATILDTSV